jgi:hypothetical protein
MSRPIFLGTLLSFGICAGAAWAQEKTERPELQPPYHGLSNITLQWNYSCPTDQACSLACPGSGSASSVTKLTIYLGSIPFSSNQNSPAMYYEFASREIPRGHGFSVSTGLGTFSCQVTGMTLDYSGPPK